MDKLKLHSPDITAGNIDKIAALFPQCVVEAKDDNGKLARKVDFDQLRQELSDTIVEGPQERYRLDWPGKRESLLAANAPIAKTLRPDREESVDFDTTQNLFIEGDNLEALKLLQETYLGKVKMIYIDPPYNTGNAFVYEDDFAESNDDYLVRSNQKTESGSKLVANLESNGRFHSDWISMLYPRLKLARNLLHQDGVIFISIDDSEVQNLRRICDETFGSDNFIATIVWQKRYVSNVTAKWLSDMHDYVLVYARSKDNVKFKSWERDAKQLEAYKNPDHDKRGKWRSQDLSASKPYSAGLFEITGPTGKTFSPPPNRYWRCNENQFNKWKEDNRIWWGVNGDARPMLKAFIEESTRGITPHTWWSYSFAGHNKEATLEVKQLFNGSAPFDTPKPVKLIRKMLELSESKDDIILDFFAGSATTANSVLELNAKDEGNRKFIMVQLPEPCDSNSEQFKAGYKNIADISKERIRRAGKKIKEENATTTANLDTGFRVLKIDTSNAKDIYYTPDAINQEELALQVDHIKDDRTAEDLLFQVMLDWGVDLALPIASESIQGKTVYFVDEDAIAACFDTSINEAFVKELAKRQPLRVVFRDTCFESDAAKINVAEIFKLLSPNTDIKTL